MATVADLYRIFLQREPDPAGLAFWEQQIKGGATPGVDSEEMQAFVSAAEAAGEKVYQPDPQKLIAADRITGGQTKPIPMQPENPAAREVVDRSPAMGNYSVADMYYQYLNRAPDAAGLSFWEEAIKGGPTRGIDPEEITAFIQAAQSSGETPNYMANVNARSVVERGEEGMFNISQAPDYTPAARDGDKTFEGQKYFESDKQNILKQLQAQQAAGMKYTASFTSDEGKILDDLATRLAAQGVKNLTDIKPIMSGETLRDTGEGQIERVESAQIGLYNAATGEPLNMKMLTNNKGDGTTNYQATFVNGIPVFTAQKAVTGLKQIQQDFGPILALAASAILPGIMIGNQTLAMYIGESLGLSKTAAEAVGSGLLAGGGTFAATGDAEKAAMAALMVGGGSYLKGSGALGDLMDATGLGDYKETFGVLNSQQIAAQGGVTGGVQDGFAESVQRAQANRFGTAGQVAGFEGIDLSTGLAGSNVGSFGNVGTGGFGTAIRTAQELYDDLVAAGISAGTAANISGLTAAGTGATALTGGATALTTTGTNTNLTTNTGGTNTNTGNTNTGNTNTNTGGTNTGGTNTGVNPLVNTATNALTTGMFNTLLDRLPDILNTGVDYAVQQRQIDQLLGVGNAAAARLNELAAKSQLTPAEYQELTRLAQQVKTETAAAGEASKVPFTPYTMTTGFGTTGVTPTGATATTAPEYEAIRRQSLGLAGQTLGAINPAQAAQTLYGQVEALAAPGREREQLALQQRLARQGLLGFGATLPTTGGAARTVNPLFESLLSAQETARAQQALQAQQFGTTEATRQAALAQGLLGQAQGIDQQTLAQLQQTGALGINLNQLEQANRARALQAQLAGISAPLTTGLSSAQLRQNDLLRQAQLSAQAAQAQTQAAIAALGPQQQQTQAVGNLASGLLNPFITAAVKEIFG